MGSGCVLVRGPNYSDFTRNLLKSGHLKEVHDRLWEVVAF